MTGSIFSAQKRFMATPIFGSHFQNKLGSSLGSREHTIKRVGHINRQFQALMLAPVFHHSHGIERFRQKSPLSQRSNMPITEQDLVLFSALRMSADNEELDWDSIKPRPVRDQPQQDKRVQLPLHAPRPDPRHSDKEQERKGSDQPKRGITIINDDDDTDPFVVDFTV